MTRHHVLDWSPRILGIGMSVFLSLFALDVFEPGTPLATALGDLTMHLAPAAIVLAIVLLSWRQAWIGGVAFVLCSVAYAMAARTRLDWIAAISGPLLVTGLLFLWSWHQQRARHA